MKTIQADHKESFQHSYGDSSLNRFSARKSDQQKCHPVVLLQRKLGNQFVQRWLQQHSIRQQFTMSSSKETFDQDVNHFAVPIKKIRKPEVQRTCAPCATGGPLCSKCRGEKDFYTPHSFNTFDAKNDAIPHAVWSRGSYNPKGLSRNFLVSRGLRSGIHQNGKERFHEKIQRFGSKEHQSLGNLATGNATVNVGGESGRARFELFHGDVIALSGDYFEAEELMQLAAVPGRRGTRVGTRDEIIWALHKIDSQDQRFQPGGSWANFIFSDPVKDAVAERYGRLAAANTSHFVAPRGRDASGRPLPNPASEGSVGRSYRGLHQSAIRSAYQAGLAHQNQSHSLAIEAAAQHFLTDAFASGHLRTPIGLIREYWGNRYPLFWFNLRHKMALDTAIRLNAQTTNLTTIVGTVQAMYEAISATIESMADKLPAVTLGDLLGKVFHDFDNRVGLAISGGRVYGDSHLDNSSPRNLTRQLATRAIQARESGYRAGVYFRTTGTESDRFCAFCRGSKGFGNDKWYV